MNILQLENKLSELDIFPTAREICTIIGMNEQSYSRKRKAGTTIKMGDIRKLEDKWGVVLVATDVIENNNFIDIPYFEASCGNGLTLDTSIIQNYDANAKYILVVAKGNSMQPTIDNNDLCIVKKYDGSLIDGIYFFNYGEETFIKRLSNNINQLHIVSDNATYDRIILKGQELNAVNIIGQVVNVIKNV